MEKSEASAPYRIVISGAVRHRLAELTKEAATRGDGEAFRAALKEFLARLTLYPQFGDPQIGSVLPFGHH